jgi:hypothetical protein
MYTVDRFSHIRVQRETKDRLDQLKAPGQSYDGLLRQILATLESIMPMLPHEGPPLPRGLGVRWSGRTKKESELNPKQVEEDRKE